MQTCMEKMGIGFYVSVVNKLLAQKILSTEMSVLVIAGGGRDRAALLESGFANVTISNLDDRCKEDEFAPYLWSFQDAECLTYGENEFDLVIVHAGLHHCHSPHRALLEMYRVACRAVLIFEARDNLFLKLATSLGISESYEFSAVKAHGFAYGGVANTCVPNYVYRWTEHEVKKAIQSYAPQNKHRFLFFYGVRLPNALLRPTRSAIRIAASILLCLVRAVTLVLPKLANEFGILILKPGPFEQLQPWLTVENGQIVMKRSQ